MQIYSSDICTVLCAQVYCGQCDALQSTTGTLNSHCECRHSVRSCRCGPSGGEIAQELYRRLRDTLPISSRHYAGYYNLKPSTAGSEAAGLSTSIELLCHESLNIANRLYGLSEHCDFLSVHICSNLQTRECSRWRSHCWFASYTAHTYA